MTLKDTQHFILYDLQGMLDGLTEFLPETKL